jgi:hypothetical protein
MSLNSPPEKVLELILNQVNWMVKKLDDLEDRLQTLEEKKEIVRTLTRKRTNYSTYRSVKELRDTGYTQLEISKQLAVPINTVRRYLTWTEQKVAAEAKKEAQKNALQEYMKRQEVLR